MVLQAFALDDERPMRIALFLPNLDGGGAERAFLNLARGLRELVGTVDLVVGSAVGAYRSEIPEGVRVVDLGASRLAFALPGLVRYLHSARPARLYSALEEANVLALLSRRIAGARTLVFPSIRNTLSQEVSGKGAARAAALRQMARVLYPGADGVIAVSAGAADDAAAVLGLTRDRITVISNPTLTPDIERLACAPLDEGWFAPGAPPVVLGCGRLVPQKDFATLMTAVAQVKTQMPVRAIILGEGPSRDELTQQACRLGLADDVSFRGFEANPFRYMARCSVFALSSRHEGSPNVLVQALACGAPVAATDCPSGPREILRDVAQGRLVPVGDAPALARAIMDLRRDYPNRAEPFRVPGFDYRASALAYLRLPGRR